jgi:hypothetical protein
MKPTTLIIIFIFIVAVGGAYYFGAREAKAPASSDEAAQAASTSPLAGDEHAYQGDNRLSAAESALVGKWQSNEDANFTRVFNADGTIVDSYTGASADQPGTWSLFTKESLDPSFTYPYEDGAVYLKVAAGQDLLFFKLVKATPDELDLIYLDRGGALTFHKI